ncbi:MAG: substrate-binding domain-containing protein [Chloroflexota bacterium]|nr:substrate-binding domain-containing protein [Chloroflexota bacterium]
MTKVNHWAGIAALASCVFALLAAGCGNGGVSTDADEVMVGLITKTDGNPFFVAMEEGARQRAYELDVELRAYTGEHDGDWESQARAMAELVEDGADGILLTPSDPMALRDAVREARQAGTLVIALDTPFEQWDAVDGTFATDNFRAGELIGRWARARLEADGGEANIATLDGYPTPVSVDVLRNQGFLKGYGIDVKDAGKIGDEDDARIVGRGVTMGTEEGGRRVMEELIGQRPSINLVYAINEPAATGAYAALVELGLAEDMLIVTIDGGCAGVRRVAAGEFGATVMQYPLEMARLGVEAVAEHARTGDKPENAPGLDFHDTGAALVTGEPVAGVPSIGVEDGLRECWG